MEQRHELDQVVTGMMFMAVNEESKRY